MKTSFPFFLPLLLIACATPEVADLGEAWKTIEKDLQTQLINAPDSSVIEIPEGSFMFSRSLLSDGKNFLTLRGQGMDKTILSFAMQEEGAEGIKIANGTNWVLEDFTIQDAKGDNIKITDTKGVTIRRVKSQWTGEPRSENGAYAFYPVLSSRVLIENCIAIGSSDAGIYVGQSDSVWIRNNEAYYNVAGIESENSRWVAIYGNQAHDNTGGILVFDLPGLTQYGHTTRVFDNIVKNNNFTNFAPEGNIVATVPQGTGLMLLATRNIEIFNNQISDNRTVGLAIASYDLVEAMATPDPSQLNENIQTAQKDPLYDPYPNDIYLHDNQFENSHWFPTFENDFGLLFLTKFPFQTPDVVWDGITPEGQSLRLCMPLDQFTFANLDAAHNFEGLSMDKTPYACMGQVIQPLLP